ncbi:MAG: 4Fe-4S binding protein [Firmicutes bacterium]|nr:4Fe-4S binding protein [Bacillota bacterium]
MKVVTMYPEVNRDKCTGCRTCERVCPVLAIKVVDKKATVDMSRCRGCAACEQRCPVYALAMVKRDDPFTVQVKVRDEMLPRIKEICARARINPEYIVCYCTATRAEEVVAAILEGAATPEEISLATGVRTGCKVECIQPVLRLLEAAGIKPARPEGGWQWYGRTITAFEIPQAVKAKFSKRGFYFDEDIKLLDKVAKATPTKEGAE